VHKVVRYIYFNLLRVATIYTVKRKFYKFSRREKNGKPEAMWKVYMTDATTALWGHAVASRSK